MTKRLARPRTRKCRSSNGYSRPSADVAQLVEHFTRNEGVPGSSPGVGFVGKRRRHLAPLRRRAQDESRRARLRVGGSRGLGDGKSYGSSSRLASGGEGRTPLWKTPAPSFVIDHGDVELEELESTC